MKKYGFTGTGTSNGIIVNINMDGYASYKVLDAAVAERLEVLKVTTAGWVYYEYDDNEARKYEYHNYKTIDQFNFKPFYEYWR